MQGQQHSYFSLQQSLSSVKVKHGGNKVGPEPQRIFGSPLDIVSKDQSVPLVVQHTVEYLEEFGKFMIPLGCDHFFSFQKEILNTTKCACTWSGNGRYFGD